MKHSILSYLILLYFYSAEAQVPSDSIQEPDVEFDTVIVLEDPYIISQPLTVEYVKEAKFYFSGYASLSNSLNYYSPCEGCEAYLAKHKSSNLPMLSIGAGTDLIYASGKMIGSVGAEYLTIRQQFNYTARDSVSTYIYNTINSNNYVNFRLSGGYWMGRNNKIISLIVSGGLVYSRLISAKGLEIDYDDPAKTRPVSESIFKKNQWSLTLGSKILLLPSRRIKLFLEPYYMGNLTDSMKNPYMYLKLHNILGVRGGFIYSL